MGTDDPSGEVSADSWLEPFRVSTGRDRGLTRSRGSPHAVRVAVLGYPPVANEFAKRIREAPGCGILAVDIGGPTADSIDTAAAIHAVERHDVDIVYLALSDAPTPELIRALEELQNAAASVYVVRAADCGGRWAAPWSEFLGMRVLCLVDEPRVGNPLLKRMMDLLISLFVLATIFPLLLTVAVLVKASSPGPIFFKQRRYGLDGAEIGVWKFRTMAVLEDGAQIMQSIKSDMRHTPIGRFLRRTSLDELPQLFNVVQGTMSLVGPRPHVIAHNEEYRRLIRGYTYRLRVKPGLTGLAEINGLRGETGTLAQVQQRVAYDLEYLRTWSPWLDLKVLFFTVAHLLKDDRAY